jgi:putative FmdB family regulatory protein
MPTYEYQCDVTESHKFEVEQKITDEPIKWCVICHCRCHRIISGSGFVLKGEGWAKDGYTKKKGK